MRLFKIETNGKFSITNDITYPTTPYAILSHIWGPDIVGCTYRDLMDGTGEKKVGYEKIRFCGEQAKRNCLQYFWVDTCCIDKSNGPELSDAITSVSLVSQSGDMLCVSWYLSWRRKELC